MAGLLGETPPAEREAVRGELQGSQLRVVADGFGGAAIMEANWEEVLGADAQALVVAFIADTNRSVALGQFRGLVSHRTQDATMNFRSDVLRKLTPMGIRQRIEDLVWTRQWRRFSR